MMPVRFSTSRNSKPPASLVMDPPSNCPRISRCFRGRNGNGSWLHSVVIRLSPFVGVTDTLNTFYATKRQPFLFSNEKCGLDRFQSCCISSARGSLQFGGSAGLQPSEFAFADPRASALVSTNRESARGREPAVKWLTESGPGAIRPPENKNEPASLFPRGLPGDSRQSKSLFARVHSASRPGFGKVAGVDRPGTSGIVVALGGHVRRFVQRGRSGEHAVGGAIDDQRQAVHVVVAQASHRRKCNSG